MDRGARLPEAVQAQLIHSELMLRYRTSFPGIIKSVVVENGALVGVDVTPAIAAVFNTGDEITYTKLPVLERIPVVFPRSNKSGFSLTIPIVEGDDCMIFCCDRSIDTWKLQGGVQPPVEPAQSRSYDLSDAVAYIAPVTSASKLTEYNGSAAELRNSDGTKKVSVSETEVKAVFGSAEVTLNATGIIASFSGGSVNITSSAIILTKGGSSIMMDIGEININSPSVKVNGTPIPA